MSLVDENGCGFLHCGHACKAPVAPPQSTYGNAPTTDVHQLMRQFYLGADLVTVSHQDAATAYAAFNACALVLLREGA